MSWTISHRRRRLSTWSARALRGAGLSRHLETWPSLLRSPGYLRNPHHSQGWDTGRARCRNWIWDQAPLSAGPSGARPTETVNYLIYRVAFHLVKPEDIRAHDFRILQDDQPCFQENGFPAGGPAVLVEGGRALYLLLAPAMDRVSRARRRGLISRRWDVLNVKSSRCVSVGPPPAKGVHLDRASH